MSELVDTKIPDDADRELLRAFLFGIVANPYKIYVDDDTEYIAIKFENGEEASMFVLKDLGNIFVKSFYDETEDDDGSSQLLQMQQLFSAVSAPQTMWGSTTTTKKIVK